MTGLNQQLSIVRHASTDFSFSVGQKFRHAETIFEIAERREGFCILQDLAAAEEHAMAHELAQCAKIEKYGLLAVDLFTRVNAARANTLAAFKAVERFKS